MYALSYRWWDIWKSYTTEHSSTRDQIDYLEAIKKNIAVEETPEFIKNFLLAYLEEQKE